MRSSAARKREDPLQRSVFDFVAPAPTDDVKHDLVELAKQMARRRDLFGVTIGEVVFEYERTTGRQVGGQKMEDKVKEQRQSSWLARVPVMAGLKRTAERRPSPVARHHKHEHRVYVWPSIRDVQR
jgi:hypothetical protein